MVASKSKVTPGVLMHAVSSLGVVRVSVEVSCSFIFGVAVAFKAHLEAVVGGVILVFFLVFCFLRSLLEPLVDVPDRVHGDVRVFLGLGILTTKHCAGSSASTNRQISV